VAEEHLVCGKGEVDAEMGALLPVEGAHSICLACKGEAAVAALDNG